MIVTYILICINCLIYLFVGQNFNTIFGLNAGFAQNFIFSFQPLTSMFLHGSLSHLIMNMVVLFQFGSILERNLGHFRFLLIYILGGIATSFLALIYVYYMLYFNAQVVTVVGASGAICVLLGVLSFLTDKETRKGLVIALLLMSFAPLFFGVNIAWYAHLLGFAIGYIYAKMSFK